MTDLLNIPRLARDVLRRYAVERVQAKLPVVWYEDGMRRSAEPNDAKYTGAWRVRSDGWESYHPTDWVMREVAKADAIEVIEE